jgi:hypothetical protein
MEGGDLRGAIAAFKEARAQGPDPSAALVQGVCHYELGEDGEARAAFREAATAPAHREAADFYLGLLALREGDDGEAARLLDAAAANPGFAPAASDLARPARRSGKWDPRRVRVGLERTARSWRHPHLHVERRLARRYGDGPLPPTGRGRPLPARDRAVPRPARRGAPRARRVARRDPWALLRARRSTAPRGWQTGVERAAAHRALPRPNGIAIKRSTREECVSARERVSPRRANALARRLHELPEETKVLRPVAGPVSGCVFVAALLIVAEGPSPRRSEETDRDRKGVIAP